MGGDQNRGWRFSAGRNPINPPPPSTVQSPSSTTAIKNSPAQFSLSMLNFLCIALFIALSERLGGSAGALPTESLLVLPSQTHAFDTVPRCPMEDANLNFRPVIGILSHPGDGASGSINNGTDVSYIAASYVKFVESGGARVIPLIYNEPWEVLYEKLSLVNGVIFTGGSCKTGLYFDVVTKIFKDVLRKNDAGHHFPLLAICLGFELVSMVVSEDINILEQFSARDQASSLQFMDNIDINKTVFQRFPPVLLKKMSTDCLLMQNHMFGISPEKFQKSKKLSSFFKILTTCADAENKVYVSTMQACRYPVTALQWHPEKNAFEWASPRIPHSEDAIQVTQQVANFVIREARISMNRPSSQIVLDNLIYNYKPTFRGKHGKGFDEVYIFS